MPHVPLLLETLRRLVLPRYMAVHVEHLAADRVHGAAELAAYAIQVCGVVCVCVCALVPALRDWVGGLVGWLVSGLVLVLVGCGLSGLD